MANPLQRLSTLAGPAATTWKLDSAPNAEALNAALSVLEAQATVDGPAREVYVRLANVGDKIYLDLCNSTWQAVEIYAEGWRIVDNPPVRFRRAPGMLPLPAPVAGGSIEALERFPEHQDRAGLSCSR